MSKQDYYYVVHSNFPFLKKFHSLYFDFATTIGVEQIKHQLLPLEVKQTSVWRSKAIFSEKVLSALALMLIHAKIICNSETPWEHINQYLTPDPLISSPSTKKMHHGNFFTTYLYLLIYDICTSEL